LRTGLLGGHTSLLLRLIEGSCNGLTHRVGGTVEVPVVWILTGVTGLQLVLLKAILLMMSWLASFID